MSASRIIHERAMPMRYGFRGNRSFMIILLLQSFSENVELETEFSAKSNHLSR